MKKILTITLILTSYIAVFAQKTSEGPKFIDLADLAAKQEIAVWLVEYDNVAWKTTDVLLAQDKQVLERLGPEWFCFRHSDGLWHAVYGKLADKKYEMILHFVMGKDGKISKTDAKIDHAFLDGHARALALSREKIMSTIPQGSPRFNQYVRHNTDKTYTVWLFPAFQPDRTAIFGGEGIYTIDSAATKIVKDDSYFQKNFRGFKSEPPRKIRLDYSDVKQPTLGAIFFAWYYRNYFTEIMIDNSQSSTFLTQIDGKHHWTTVEKQK